MLTAGTGLHTKHFPWVATCYHPALEYGYSQQNPTTGIIDLEDGLSYFHLPVPVKWSFLVFLLFLLGVYYSASKLMLTR